MPIFQGNTTAEAIENGLKSLGLSLEDVSIESITEGKKGFFGIGKQLAEVELVAKKKPNKVEDNSSSEESTPIQLEEDKVTATISVETLSTTDEKDIDFVEDKKKNEESTLLSSSKKDLSSEEAITEVALYLTKLTKELDAPALVKIKRQSNYIEFDLETDKQGRIIGKHGKVLNAIQYLAQVYIHRITSEKISITVNVGDYREKRDAILTRLARKTASTVKKTGQPVFLEPMPAFERKKIHTELSTIPNIKTHSEGEEPFRYLVVELDRKSID